MNGTRRTTREEKNEACNYGTVFGRFGETQQQRVGAAPKTGARGTQTLATFVKHSASHIAFIARGLGWAEMTSLTDLQVKKSAGKKKTKLRRR